MPMTTNKPQRIVQLVSTLNAAVWLGAAVLFTFIAGPAFFDPALKDILPKPEDGIAARFLIGRFTAFQIACACVAVITLLVDWRMGGGQFPCAQALLLGGIILLITAAILWLTPQLDALHQVKYAEHFGKTATAVESDTAAKAFGRLHGLSMISNLLVLIGLLAQFVLNWKAVANASPNKGD